MFAGARIVRSRAPHTKHLAGQIRGVIRASRGMLIKQCQCRREARSGYQPTTIAGIPLDRGATEQLAAFRIVPTTPFWEVVWLLSDCWPTGSPNGLPNCPSIPCNRMIGKG